MDEFAPIGDNLFQLSPKEYLVPLSLSRVDSIESHSMNDVVSNRSLCTFTIEPRTAIMVKI